jgi:hypothetical protein
MWGQWGKWTVFGTKRRRTPLRLPNLKALSINEGYALMGGAIFIGKEYI